MDIFSVDVAIDGRYLEAKAAAEIYPGMLLQRNSAGEVLPHSTADGIAIPLIAMEDAISGVGIETPYEIGDMVHIRYCLPGDVFIGLGFTSETVPIEIGFCSSYGGGYLKNSATSLYDRCLVGYILECESMVPYLANRRFVRVEVI